ncbi:type II toxin-antitoxin system RelE/ParE family toxin [Pseudomonas sp. TH08]|uniref:type II toxin-antitoxin system RelE/ParE family toxin n=1 Tax=unclassified Pseudomonas TaxID=196821 RepID=UPI001913ACB3|nr:MULTISPECIES: type II toxin-antitoxin system RelE/ParE family toxin [unclassified Pseudomonas]MBK5377839.1 type II toxin-antitoxin system RelE/ParE family toxin [Pseudomonas sp. TH43]MBK5509613.1 type II toxin-antitoxin system RelE/ParE family toxin [Pseudomonas sp. TH15]MBK5532314.1 type II toxin-antitoxin system RelE/ParE family toxin [Pseudomonas sp. TH08]
MRIIWTKRAVQDRENIWDYLHAANPKAALEMDRRFTEAVSRISQNPKIGPVGIIAGTRELIPHPSYRLVYQPNHDVIWILTLVHTARTWPFPT